MSALRARCPDCRANTCVALGGDYQCHACGREWSAGLLRVARAWGDGGIEMEEASLLEVDWPEAGLVDEETLTEQIAVTGRLLPERPVVLGGCCCCHVGAVRELARRHGRVGVLWFDAHGDLNTPESSPSGNAWGMPLRMLIDDGDVDARDVTLVGARALDPPEEDFIVESGIRTEIGDLPDRLYVAIDCDVLDPRCAEVFMPEPGGLDSEELECILAAVPRPLGAGFSGLVGNEDNAEVVERLGHALGL